MWRSFPIKGFAFLLICAHPAFAQEPGPFAAFDKASEAVLADPHDLTIGPDGRLYVADKFGARIAVLDAETLEVIEMLGEGLLPGVHDISFGTDGKVAVAVTGASAVALYPDIAALNQPPKTGVSAPRSEGALLHSNGDLYAMASGTGVLMRVRGSEVIGLVNGHFGAHDVAEAPDSSVWVADNNARKLVRYSPELELLQTLDDPKFGFIGPRYLDVTRAGLLVVADQDAHRILLIDPRIEGGALLGMIGDGLPGLGPNKFDDPEGVAVEGPHYYFSDSDNNRVVRYTVILN
ncbi:MAG: NHL repeat-containing protein [Paracoccaceae bacterium]